MADQNIGRRITGSTQQRAEVTGHARDRACLTCFVTPADTGAVIADRTCGFPDNFLHRIPTQRATRESGFEDAPRFARAGLAYMQPPAPELDQTPWRGMFAAILPQPVLLIRDAG